MRRLLLSVELLHPEDKQPFVDKCVADVRQILNVVGDEDGRFEGQMDDSHVTVVIQRSDA